MYIAREHFPNEAVSSKQANKVILYEEVEISFINHNYSCIYRTPCEPDTRNADYGADSRPLKARRRFVMLRAILNLFLILTSQAMALNLPARVHTAPLMSSASVAMERLTAMPMRAQQVPTSSKTGSASRALERLRAIKRRQVQSTVLTFDTSGRSQDVCQ